MTLVTAKQSKATTSELQFATFYVGELLLGIDIRQARREAGKQHGLQDVRANHVGQDDLSPMTVPPGDRLESHPQRRRPPTQQPLLAVAEELIHSIREKH